MAQSFVSTPDTAGPIRDPNARRVCSLAGINDARQKVITLRQLRDAVDISIRELESERQKEAIIDKALLVARLTKATCDTFIAMAGALAKVAMPGKAGEEAERFAAGYAAATPLISAAATSDAGGKAEWGKAVAASVKEGVTFVAPGNPTAEILTKSTVVKVEIIKGALNHDHEEVIRSGASYLADLHATVAEMTKSDTGETVAAFTRVAKSAFEYNDQIGKAFDQLIEDDQESKERFESLKRNLERDARRLSQQISKMEQFISECWGEFGDYQLDKGGGRRG
jgi:hypothetical protein